MFSFNSFNRQERKPPLEMSSYDIEVPYFGQYLMESNKDMLSLDPNTFISTLLQKWSCIDADKCGDEYNDDADNGKDENDDEADNG